MHHFRSGLDHDLAALAGDERAATRLALAPSGCHPRIAHLPRLRIQTLADLVVGLPVVVAVLVAQMMPEALPVASVCDPLDLSSRSGPGCIAAGAGRWRSSAVPEGPAAAQTGSGLPTNAIADSQYVDVRIRSGDGTIPTPATER